MTLLSPTLDASRLRSFVENAPCISAEDFAAQFTCVICQDTGWIYLETPLRRCDCRRERIRAERFQTAVALTPTKFRDRYGITDGLNSMRPMPEVHNEQPKTLELLKRNAEKSFYFYGKTGTHKSTFAWALAQEAGRRGQKVGGNTGKSLADTLRNYAIHQTAPKDCSFYSLAQLEESETRFCVVLDEIENFPLTEYSLSTLFELIDKVQAYEQQILITSNKSIDALLKEWAQRDRDGKANAVNFCEKLARRLHETCAAINFS